ncbi:TPA: 50S ribosomal protein L5, partial [Patescibacteria group bacterium]|nr:50S ribosomal protein L5 [Patescibacteria group bacterium]
MSLLDQYNSTIKPELKKELGIANLLAVPKLTKIVVNVGLGEALADRKLLDKVAEQLAVITGQKPLATTAKV